MINCPNCSSNNIYYEDTICVWQKPNGEWELDNEESETILDSDKSEKRLICCDCGVIFKKWQADSSDKEYKLHVSKIEYGIATVKAGSEKIALDKFNNGEVKVDYIDSEISDVNIEPV